MGVWYPKWYPKNSGCLEGTQGMGGELPVSGYPSRAQSPTAFVLSLVLSRESDFLVSCDSEAVALHHLTDHRQLDR